jgi:uncharacterized membrane protein YedE/YeeE
MSVGEWIGFALTVALLAGAAGVGMGARLGQKRSAGMRHRRRVADACAYWLAARWTLSRTSMSFVAAFRALGAEPRDAPNYELREQEAQRARGHWCEAMGEFDRREAALVIFALSEGIPYSPSDRVDAEELRAAIQGDARGVAALRIRLQAADRDAMERTRQILADVRENLTLRALGQAFAAWTRRLVVSVRPKGRPSGGRGGND